MGPRPFVVAIIFTTLLGVGCAEREASAPDDRSAAREADDKKRSVEITVEPILTSPPSWAQGEGRPQKLWKQLATFYESRGYEPAWLDDGVPTPAARRLADVVGRADEHGLDPADYDLSQLASLPQDDGTIFDRPDVDAATAAEADVRTSWVFLRYASDLRQGHVDPKKVDGHWTARDDGEDPAALLPAVIDEDRTPDVLDALAPRHPHYDAMRAALGRYRKVVADGGWPVLPEGAKLKKGARGPEVALLRRRLALEGDLDPSLAPAGAQVRPAALQITPGVTATPAPLGPVNDYEVFDGAVEQAVKSFQQRHGLGADGVVGGTTLSELNVPARERADKLALNLERWRWLPTELGDRYVVVNIPAFELQGFEGGKPTIAMRVVVGTEKNPTPIFSDRMETVVFSPYWNVTRNILVEETAPAILRDPGYIYDNDLEVLRGNQVVPPYSVDWSNPAPDVRVRQRPGRRNALGGVKFIFPNKFDVYLHDTPADSLFARGRRAFSHGCVRVQKPEELARWVLRDWSPERIRGAMWSGREQHVPVRPAIPVYLTYATAWVDPEGRVQFRDDLYGHDARQGRLLPQTPPPPPATPGPLVTAVGLASPDGKPGSALPERDGRGVRGPRREG